MQQASKTSSCPGLPSCLQMNKPARGKRAKLPAKTAKDWQSERGRSVVCPQERSEAPLAPFLISFRSLRVCWSSGRQTAPIGCMRSSLMASAFRSGSKTEALRSVLGMDTTTAPRSPSWRERPAGLITASLMAKSAPSGRMHHEFLGSPGGNESREDRRLGIRQHLMGSP